LLSNKPIVTMVKTINNKANNCVFINNLNKDLETIINNVKNNIFNTISNQEKIDFINALNTSSYKGLISDPFIDVNCVSKKNISDILVAFNSILNKQN
jgi:hypothetical protein